MPCVTRPQKYGPFGSHPSQSPFPAEDLFNNLQIAQSVLESQHRRLRIKPGGKRKHTLACLMRLDAQDYRIRLKKPISLGYRRHIHPIAAGPILDAYPVFTDCSSPFRFVIHHRNTMAGFLEACGKKQSHGPGSHNCEFHGFSLSDLLKRLIGLFRRSIWFLLYPIQIPSSKIRIGNPFRHKVFLNRALSFLKFFQLLPHS